MVTEKRVTGNNRPTREKSALYPAASIESCYDFIQKIDSLGGRAVAYASVLDLLGLTSPTTKSFLSRVSASKQFGFITTEAQTIQLTDQARRILYPVAGEAETQRLLVEAFWKPPLYAKLIERFKNKAVPEKGQLSNILMNEYEIIRQVKDNAAACFLKSASYLGLLKNGMLCMDNRAAETPTDVSAPMLSEEKNQAAVKALQPNSVGQPEEGYHFQIPTLGGKAARFYIPSGVTERDLDYIELYIRNMLPAFLDNLKAELQDLHRQ